VSSSRPIAFITGASAGIGATFARQLSKRGYDLILVARRAEKLREIAAQVSTHAETISADLNVPADCTRLAERLAAEPRLELLINNAGFGTLGRFWEAGLAGQLQMHQVHVTATVVLTHAALKSMVPRGRGAVINVASVAGFSRSPANVSYCATKTWSVAFTEGLSLDLRTIGSKVRVQALCPGFTYSEFHDVMGTSRERIPRFLWMNADDVVAESLRGLESGKLIVVPGFAYKMFVALFTRLPHSWRMSMQAKSPHTKDRLGPA
jgi:short-subunit dehydrogenase